MTGEGSGADVADQLRTVLDAAGTGIFDFAVAPGTVEVDRRTRDFFGLRDDGSVHAISELFEVIHPDDLPTVQEAIRAAERTLGPYSTEHRVCPPGGDRWLEVHGQAQLRDDGVHILGTVRDSTELRSARDRVARVLEHVGEAFVSLDHEGHLTYVNSRAEQLLRRPRESLIGRVLWHEFPELVGSRFEEYYHAFAEGDQVTRVLEEYFQPLRAWIEVRAHPGPDGLSIYFSDVTARRDGQERTRRLQQVAAALARALTVQDVAEATLEHAARGMAADSAGVLLRDDDRRELRLIAGLLELSDALRDRWTTLPLSAHTPLNTAVETGTPQLLTLPELIRDYPHLARDAQAAGAGFYALLPLITAGAPLGVLVLAWQHRDEVSDEELAFLVAVSAQCAQALERAQLYEQQRRIAESLQRSLLPQQLPEIANVELGARYQAGAAGLQVGGDWYDVLPLRDGRVAFALGDVVGKGLPAAAAMGQVRYALRAYATLDPAPAAVLSALDEFFAVRDDEELVTVVYGVLDPRDGVLVWSNAGHPPPLLLGQHEARVISARSDGTPLGVPSARSEATLQLAAGDALLLYSDGLVESRRRPLGEGLDELVRIVADGALRPLPADELCSAVLADLLKGREAEDDATLLALRWGGARATDESRAEGSAEATVDPPHVASTKLRPEALASSSARRFVRSLLDRWALLELTDVAELCVSELVTNAVLHARTPIQVEVRAGRGVLHVDVCDSGGGRIDLPPPDEPGEGLESGRGLYIVQALSARTGASSRRNGTCVWFELDLPSGNDHDRSESIDVS